MPSSRQTPTPKLLIDENVRAKLYRFLKQKGFDVKLAVKGTSDKMLSNISKSEKRVLVTNDEDFSESTKEEVYAVVWLKIAQNDKNTLLKSFETLLRKKINFAGKLVILYDGKWDEVPLFEEIKG